MSVPSTARQTAGEDLLDIIDAHGLRAAPIIKAEFAERHELNPVVGGLASVVVLQI